MRDFDACPLCEAQPCRCAGESGDAACSASFTLLPTLDGEFEEEERFTRLLREVKRGVLRRDFVAEDESRDLARRARELQRLVEDKDLQDADGVATGLVSSVLEFPRTPFWARCLSSPRLLVWICASALMTVIVAILVLTS